MKFDLDSIYDFAAWLMKKTGKTHSEAVEFAEQELAIGKPSQTVGINPQEDPMQAPDGNKPSVPMISWKAYLAGVAGNLAILTPDARAKRIEALRKKYEALKKQYNGGKLSEK
jgi:hypothetical protein